jgi:hypothetical protein
MMLGFVITGAATLLNVGRRQQRTLRLYSQVQTDLRASIRRATRALRHASEVVNPSTATNFPVKSSGASQVIVTVPEPSGSSPSTVQIRFYLSSGNFYAQRSDNTGPGVLLESGVQSLTFNYFRTVGSSRTAVDASPSQATEIQIAITGSSGNISSKLTTLVALRNVLVSL